MGHAFPTGLRKIARYGAIALACVVVCGPLIPQSARALSSPTSGEPTIAAPSPLTYQSLKSSIDQSTGAFTQNIPLDIPPGRGGLQPDLSLQYNSQNTSDSIVGYGWTISIPSIERLNKAGSERLYNDSYFTSSLGGELATTSASTTVYRHKFEDGRFIRYAFSDNTWIAYDKKGTKYTFGSTNQARQFATTSTSTVNKWMIEEIRDTNDNYISFTYSKDGNELYPSQITYTGHASADGPFTIAFSTSTRPDPYIKYKGGIKVTTNYLISQITASVNGTQVRRYALGYVAGNNGVRSLLSSVQRTGRDDNGVELSEPATTFSYSATSTSFVSESPGVPNSAYVAADADGNGRNDLSIYYVNTAPDGQHVYYVHDGESVDTVSSMPPTTWGKFNSNLPVPYFPQEIGTRFLDVNGDGKADIVRGWQDDISHETTGQMWLSTYATSTGFGWATTTPAGSVPVFSWTDRTYILTTGLLGDVNGDGVADYIKALTQTGDAAYLGNGLGWAATTSVFVAVEGMPGTSGGPGSNAQLVDINGDGLEDWVYSAASSTYVKLNTGTGWETTPDAHWTIATSTYYTSTQGGSTAYWDRGVRFVDINGDGLVDFVRAYNMPSYGTCLANPCSPPPEIETVKIAYLNTGSGWAATTSVSFPDGYIAQGGMSSGNWDGKMSTAEWINWRYNGQKDQDVLKQVSYPRGGNEQVEYIPTAFTGTNVQLPISLLVARKITTNDNNGHNQVVNYAYEGGKLYLANGVREKRFAGFFKTTETRADSISTTYFNQGDSVSTAIGEQSDGLWQVGKPFRKDITTSSGSILKRSYYRWDSSAATTTSTTTTASIARGNTPVGTSMGTSPVTASYTVASSSPVVAVLAYCQGTVNTPTLSDGTTNYTSAGDASVSWDSSPGHVWGFYLDNANPGAKTFTLTFTGGGQCEIFVAGWTGAGVDTLNTMTTTASSPFTISTSTSSTDDWLVAFAGGRTGETPQSGTSSWGSGFYDSNGSVGAAGSHSLSWSLAAPEGAYGFMLGLKPTTSTTTATAAASTTLAMFTYLASQLDEDFGPSGTHRDHGITYAYDATTTGDLLRSVDYGEVTGNSDGTFTDTGSDKRTRDLTYAYATSTHLNVLIQDTVSNNAGTRVQETKSYFDGLSFGSVSTGNQTKQENWISGSTYASSTKAYNSYGLPTESRDARYNPTTYVYDWYNMYPATTTDALSHSTSVYYDYATGKAKKKIDPNGYTWESIFDPLGRIKEEKIPDPQSGSLVTKATYSYSDIAYPSYQQTTVYLNSASSTDSYTYFDGLGRVFQERSKATSTYYTIKDKEYSSAGVLYRDSLPYFAAGASSTSATTSVALWATHIYDGLHRPTAVGTAVGTTSFAYDGWKTTQTDVLGKTKDAYTDAFGNLVQVDEHNSTSTYSTYYEYDTLNNLTKLTDASANIRNFTYDGLGRRLTAQDLHASGDATFGTWTYAYDDAGNQTQTVDPKSQTVNYTFDALNRTLTEDYTGQSGTETTYAYDSCTNGVGRLCTASSTVAKTIYTYDAAGNTASEEKQIGGTSYTTSYASDRLGNLTSVTYPNNGIAQYWYNPSGRLERVAYKKADGSSYVDAVKNIDYAPTGQVQYKLFGNGVQTTYSYNPAELYRLSSILTNTLVAGGGGGMGVLALASPSSWASRLAHVTKDFLAQLAGDPVSLLSATTTDTATTTPDVPAPVLDTATTIAPAAEAATSTASATSSSLAVLPEAASTTPAVPSTDAASTTPVVAVSATTTAPAAATTTPVAANTILASTTIATATSTAAVASTSATILGPIESILADKTPEERADIKGRELAKIGHVPRTARAGVDIEVVSAEAIPGGLQVFARAWSKDGNQIGFGHDGSVEIERFRIFNPPVLVPDGTTHLATSTMPNGSLHEFQESNFKEDPQEALLQTLEQIIAVKKDKFGPEHIKAGKVGNTTSTFFSTREGESRRGDTLSESWATIRGGNGTAAANNGSSMYAPFINADTASSMYQLHQIPFFPFDTSPIGTDSISAATFSIVTLGEWTGNGDLNVNISAATMSNPVAASNYESTISSYATALSSDKTISSFTSDDATYNDFALNASGIAGINKTGETDLALRFAIDIAGSGTPTWASSGQSGLQHRGSEYAGTTKDPKLVIEHGAAPISGGGIQNVSFTYDSIGNITSMTDASDTLTNHSISFTYDDLNRLLTASTTAATSTPFRHVFTYDPLGNLTSSPLGSYAYAGTSYANPHAPTTIGSATYSYDNDGNLTGDGSTSYTWDWKNRLTQVSTSTNVAYAYDHGMNRVRMATASATTTYPSKYFSVASSTNTATTTSYIYAGDTLIATIDGTGLATSTRYVHPDYLGSTNVLTDGATGAVVQTLDYYPYGATRISSSVGGADVKRKYIGQMYDEGAGLNYLNARYYEANRGQFLSQDPMFTGDPRNQNLMDPQSLNSYSYAENNPIVQSDPSGRCPWCVTAAVGAGVGGLIGVGGQALGDVLSGHSIGYSGWQAYTGAAAGGATLGAFWGSGAGLLTLAGTGLLAGTVQGGVREGLNYASGNGFNGGSVASDAFLGLILNPAGGLATRYVGLPVIEGLNAGRGSYDSIFKQIFTNLDSGAISNVSPSTYAKMGVSYGYSGAYSTGAQAVIQARQQATQSYNASLGGGSGSGPNPNSLWTTPSGAVVNWGGSLIAGPVANTTPSH